ncbi:MAG: FkbM family methyltransferase [Anaerolineales bacterium]|nr:MAG: FkbM family methyltransferase [Anaerolineales bacterium]
MFLYKSSRKILCKIKAITRRIFIGDEFRLTALEKWRLHFSKPRSQQSVSLLGKKIQITDSFWFEHLYRDIFEQQIYKFISPMPDPLIIDCGAHIGLSVIYFKKLYPQSTIVAFEPDPEIFSMLNNNINLLNLENVDLYQAAVWESNGTIKFSPNGSVGGKIAKDDGANRSGIIVKTIRLKEFLGKPIQFLKIDIEGAENKVLPDIASELSMVQHMFVEYHGDPNQDQTVSNILDIIQKAGFKYFITQAHPYPPAHPFIVSEYAKYTFDLQLNIFCYRKS